MSLSTRPVGVDRVTAWLDDLPDPDPSAVGSKAANLALALSAGLPIIPGFVVTTSFTGRLGPRSPAGWADALHDDWSALTADGSHPVVVRSSSPVEDTSTSSMAGVFRSVVDVRTWEAFRDAVVEVVRSGQGSPMAVLVQRHIDPALGGVLFGVDPTTGRRDHRLVVAARGGPWPIVSGEIAGRRSVLTTSGRIVTSDGDPTPRLGRRDRRRLVHLEGRVAARFGGPQDIEWAIDTDEGVWLLQTRPVTAVAEQGSGPLLGPGPIGETFPHPMSRLEADLWLTPVREAIAHTLAMTGSASRHQLATSPIAVLVDERAAVDLDLVEGRSGKGLLGLLDPRPRIRRLLSAWRVGRLHAAFDTITTETLSTLDRSLGDIPSLDELTDDELLRLLANVRRHLVAVHSHEMLAVRLGRDTGSTAPEVALRALAAARRAGWDDDDTVARQPIVLSLVAPRIATPRRLPATPAHVAGTPLTASLSDREAFRLRARWLHEVSARAALELGRRLARRGVVTAPDDVAALDLDELTAAATTGLVVVDVAARPDTPPLPAEFRLSPTGRPVAERRSGSEGTGASPGRGEGVVSHGDPRPGEVLVVATLDPALASLLPDLGGLVAETGSALSHLAILAREYRVPAVVGLADARARFTPGQRVLVDGTTGEVTVVERGEP